MDVLARQSQDLKAPDRLAGRGRPIAADFRGGKLLAIGFEDGALAVFGFHGWLRFHAGAVGAVRVLPHRMQASAQEAAAASPSTPSICRKHCYSRKSAHIDLHELPSVQALREAVCLPASAGFQSALTAATCCWPCRWRVAVQMAM